MATPVVKKVHFILPEPEERSTEHKPQKGPKLRHRPVRRTETPYAHVFREAKAEKNALRREERKRKRKLGTDTCFICEKSLESKTVPNTLIFECAHTFHKVCAIKRVERLLQCEKPVSCPRCGNVQTKAQVDYILSFKQPAASAKQHSHHHDIFTHKEYIYFPVPKLDLSAITNSSPLKYLTDGVKSFLNQT